MEPPERDNEGEDSSMLPTRRQRVFAAISQSSPTDPNGFRFYYFH